MLNREDLRQCPPPRKGLVERFRNGFYRCFGVNVQGATHVDICTNVRETFDKLQEGATHVDICTNVRETFDKLQEGATHVETCTNVRKTFDRLKNGNAYLPPRPLGEGARSAGEGICEYNHFYKYLKLFTNFRDFLNEKFLLSLYFPSSVLQTPYHIGRRDKKIKPTTNKLQKLRYAFTLAEVLITLGVIGIVAALTLPTLISNHKKLVTETRLKSAYSILYEAVKLSETQNDEIKYWSLPKNTTTECENFAKKYLLPYMKYTETGIENGGILPDYPSEKLFYIKLVNGTIFYVHSGEGLDIYVDINGKQQPNLAGYDRFAFLINIKESPAYSKGVSPIGRQHALSAGRNSILSACGNNEPWLCSALIEHDGWKIKSDYPYRI